MNYSRLNPRVDRKWLIIISGIMWTGLGIFIRTTGLIPKIILAPMYIGIGTALFLASFKYYKNLI